MPVSRCGLGITLTILGALGVVASLFTSPSTVAAQDSVPNGAYTGTASADGLRVTYEVKGFLVVDRLADGGGPVAQATVSSLESVGFASAPYPGDTVLSAPPLVAGTANAPVPDYPLVASSRYPTVEEQTVDQGVVRLSATSTATSSTARGVGGGPDDDNVTAGTTRAGTEVVHDEATGEVTAKASTEAEAFSVADVFRIGRVASTATVVDAPNSLPKRETSMQIGEVTIAGQAVKITDSGVSVAGSSTPLPASSPLLAALADQGIEVRYLAAEETPDGVVAPGLEVRVAHPIPTAPSPGVAVYQFGRASASATGGLGTFGAGGDGLGDVSVPVVDSPTVDPGDSTSGVVVDDTVAEFVPSPLDTAPTPDASSTPAAESDERATAPVALVTTPQWAKSWTLAFYLVIVLSGVAVVGGGQLIRLVAVRMPWTS